MPLFLCDLLLHPFFLKFCSTPPLEFPPYHGPPHLMRPSGTDAPGVAIFPFSLSPSPPLSASLPLESVLALCQAFFAPFLPHRTRVNFPSVLIALLSQRLTPRHEAGQDLTLLYFALTPPFLKGKPPFRDHPHTVFFFFRSPFYFGADSRSPQLPTPFSL